MGEKTVPLMTTKAGWLSYERTLTDMTFEKFAAHLTHGPGTDDVRYYTRSI
jgi:hypothetical protein